jgi:prophage antirepressor-like protein
MSLKPVSLSIISQQFADIIFDMLIDLEGVLWVRADQLCLYLGHSNTSKTVSTYVDEEDRQQFDLDAIKANWFVNEYGMYSILLNSTKPKAKPFKKWLSHTVIPSIRKNGGFLSPDATQSQLLNLKEQIETKLLAIETAYDVCKEMGDDRGMIETRSALLNLSNKMNDENQDVPPNWKTISEILEDYGHTFSSKEMKTSLNQIGRKVRPLYEKETGKKVLVTSKHLGSGHVTEVKLYPPEWNGRILTIAIEYWKSKKLLH